MKLKDLSISVCNIRQQQEENGGIDTLAESIKSESLISKLILRPAKEKDKYEVVAGGRRLKALLKAYGPDHDLVEAEYVVREGLSDDEAYMLSLEENQQRMGLSPMELCRASLRLNQMGIKDKDVATRLNITPHRLKRIQVLAAETRKMPDAAKDELSKPCEEGKFNDAHWDKLHEESPEVIKDAVDYIIEHEAPPRDVPGIVTGIKKRYETPTDDGTGKRQPAASGDDTPSGEGGPIVYEHKGILSLIEKKGKMSFMVQGKGEDEEIPIDHYLEYLRHPDKFKCRVSLRLKFTPVD